MCKLFCHSSQSMHFQGYTDVYCSSNVSKTCTVYKKGTKIANSNKSLSCTICGQSIISLYFVAMDIPSLDISRRRLVCSLYSRVCCTVTSIVDSIYFNESVIFKEWLNVLFNWALFCWRHVQNVCCLNLNVSVV